ncbi:hypothetical protein B0H14DRAFT_2615824 [Mycena olivaceomarginata]|nr:hypothetical protein B0H14DRAFT_2615824 [Mycena olivaceomarginata]
MSSAFVFFLPPTVKWVVGLFTTPSGNSFQQTGPARKKKINPENWKATFGADGLALTSDCRECLDEGRANIRAQQEGAAEKENKPGDAASGNDGSDFIGVTAVPLDTGAELRRRAPQTRGVSVQLLRRGRRSTRGVTLEGKCWFFECAQD